MTGRIQLKDKGLSAWVVRGIHTLLHNCLEQAVAERLILTNPAKGCRLPKLECHQPVHVTHKSNRRGADDTIRPFPVVSAFGSAFGSCEKYKRNT